MPGRDESLPGIWPHVIVSASISSVALRVPDLIRQLLVEPAEQATVSAAAALGSAAGRSGLTARRSGLAASRDRLAAGRGRLAARRGGLAAGRNRLAARRGGLAAANGRRLAAAHRGAAARLAAALLLVAVAEEAAEEAFLLAAALLAAADRLAAGRFRSTAARGRRAATMVMAKQAGVSGARADTTDQQGGTQGHPLHSGHLLEINFGTNVRISGMGRDSPSIRTWKSDAHKGNVSH